MDMLHNRMDYIIRYCTDHTVWYISYTPYDMQQIICTVLKPLKGMPCHVIYFENIKDSLKVIMNSILNFISVEIENFDDRMQCLQENSEGNFHREEYGSKILCWNFHRHG